MKRIRYQLVAGRQVLSESKSIKPIRGMKALPDFTKTRIVRVTTITETVKDHEVR
jgi:hypothetical protein